MDWRRAVVVLTLGGVAMGHASEGERLFVEKVRPLLAAKCLACHGEEGKRIKGEFDMRTREGVLAGGESGLAGVMPGDAEASPVYVAVTWADEDLEMPPKENDRLTAEEVGWVKAWIEAGAPWVDGEAEVAALPAGTWSKVDGEGTVRIGTSGAESAAWAGRAYDAEAVWGFRERAEVEPPEGGHPIDAFVDAKLAEAGLEAAPRATDVELRRRLAFGITGLPPEGKDGEVGIGEYVEVLLGSPHFGERMAQHWMDVVRYADSNGFSRDDERPEAHKYRTYVIDSFNADKPYDRFVKEQIAGDELKLAGQEALSFLWMGPYEMTAMTAAAVARQMWLDDVVNSVGVTFLGQELRCAKCHDHKFDPIPTRDYYALQAVFAGTAHHVKNGQYRVRPQKLETVSILKGGSLESPTEAVGPGLLSAVGMARDFAIPEGGNGRRAALAKWVASGENPLTARVMVNRVWQWHFGRGLVATANGFGVVGSRPTHPELLDWLAGWFVENGWSVKELTRLIVTSEAYRRSTRHPGAQKLAKVDPDGTLLAAFSPRRLSAEEIWDGMLAASGELNRRVGGPSYRAQINWDVAFQARLAMGKIVPPWQPEAKRADRHRRSVYAKRIRNLGHPVMEVMNRPPTELSCERRDETTVVTQAFSLFHGDFVNGRARALAKAVDGEVPGGMSEKVEAVFGRVLGRAPTAEERERSMAHVEKMLAHHRSHEPERTELPTQVKLSNVIEKTGEPAYSTFKLDKMADYERDVQPWELTPEGRALAELCLVLLNSSEFLHVY